MALIGCERCGRTGPPKIDQKVAPSVQEIALFLEKSTRTLMTGQKKKKNASVIDHILLLLQFELKVHYFFSLEKTIIFEGKSGKVG